MTEKTVILKLSLALFYVVMTAGFFVALFTPLAMGAN